MNGTLGMSAQELTNRGFDNEMYEINLSSKWYNYFECIPPSFKLISDDMYNENGAYFIKTEVGNRNTFKIYLLK